MAKKNRNKPNVPHEETEQQQKRRYASERNRQHEETANPPRTTSGPITAPKFGSAGSGGAELEPGPRKN
ncbi:MAG TPA: hypothetical protein VJ672_04960 [Gemmatimonadaceae bacterium]|nr:hypothetical protein [Gemmatimonadaceae bacterium]